MADWNILDQSSIALLLKVPRRQNEKYARLCT